MVYFKSLLLFFVIPGFFFTLALGLLISWLERKVSARLQYRQGPPWFQPLADIVKLFGKETIKPEGIAAPVFFGAPLVGLVAATLTATILWLAAFYLKGGFLGDLIVVLYLLTVPSTALIIGGSASRNPLAALGASREMKLILAYELPFVLAVFTVVAKTRSIMFCDILNYQAAHWPTIFSLSGLVAFVAALLVVQAKLGLVPFDIAEAEQEIAAGPLLEYSGAPLALFKMTKAMLLAILPLLLTFLFFGGRLVSPGGFFWLIAGYLLVTVLIILIKNTNPRLRIDQALRFFWGPVTLLAAAGFVLAMVGL